MIGSRFVKFGRDCASKAIGVRWTAGRMESFAIGQQHEREQTERMRVHNGEPPNWAFRAVFGVGTVDRNETRRG